MARGKYLMVDGPKSVGKSTVMEAWEIAERHNNDRIFDLRDYWARNHNVDPSFLAEYVTEGGQKVMNPHYVPLDSFDTLVAEEPTHTGMGTLLKRMARGELPSRPARELAYGHAADRWDLYHRLIVPALDAGKDVLQECGLPSANYQVRWAQVRGEDPISFEDIFNFDLHAIVREYRPDQVLILDHFSARTLEERKVQVGDRIDVYADKRFQLGLRKLFKDPKMKELFESVGTRVEYLDTTHKTVKDISVRATELYQEVMGKTIQ